MNLNQSQAISTAGLQLELRSDGPVHHSGRAILDAARTGAANENDLVEAGIEGMRRVNHDQRTIHSGIRLHQLVDVRVIDESTSSWRSEFGDETVVRRDSGSDFPRHSAPASDSVRVTLNLHSVPMN